MGRENVEFDDTEEQNIVLLMQNNGVLLILVDLKSIGCFLSSHEIAGQLNFSCSE